MSEDPREPSPLEDAFSMHWGYIMGLTAANLALTKVLMRANVIKAEDVIDELHGMKEQLQNDVNAVRWLEITEKHIKEASNEL